MVAVQLTERLLSHSSGISNEDEGHGFPESLLYTGRRRRGARRHPEAATEPHGGTSADGSAQTR